MSILSKSVKPLLGRLDFQSLKHIRWTDVKYKLAFGFGLLILLSALSTYFSITFLADMKQQMDHLVSQSAAKVKITGQLKSDLLAVGHAEKRLILVKTSDLKDQQVAVISAAKDRISAGMEALALIADRDADEDLSGTLDEFRETWFSYLDVHASVVEHSSKNSNVRAQSMSSKEASPAYRNLMKQVDGLLKKATLDEERNLEAAKVAQSNANLSSDLYEAIMLFTREENTWAMAADEKETAKAARNMLKLNKDINKWLQQLQESKGNLTMVVNQVVKGWHQYRENVGDSNNIYERLMNMDRYAKDLIRIEKQMVQLRKFNRSSNNGAARKATAAVAHAKQLRQLKALLIDMQLNERAILASDNRMFMGVTTGQSKKIGRDVAAIFEELKQSLAYGLVSELEKAFANYSDLHFKVARINEENGNVKAFQLSTLAAAPLADRAEALLDTIIVSAEESMIADQESTAAAYQQAVIMTLAFSIISVVIGVVVALWIARGISKGLSRLVNIAKRVQIYGDFSLRTGIDSQDEIGSVARAFDALLDQLQAVLNETNQVLASIARGEFSDRVSVDLEGDLATLKTGVNESASSVDNTMQALEQLMVALGNFDFSARLDNSVEGELKEQVDASMERMELAITEVRQVMQAVAEGDFDQRVDSDLLGDMGVLKSAINDSLDELQEAIHETSEVVAMQSNGDMTARIVGNYGGTLGSMKDSLNQSAGNLEHTLSEVSAVAGHVTSMAGEVAQVSADLSTRTQSQASSLEETAASMEQLSATVIENADHAEQAKSMAEEALQLATNSAGISRRATDSMGQISASSKQMAEIIELIDSIAFQTNLLALNASVEAARAGEQGRGFAVVATEVRELAQKTADASKDIKELIEVNLSRIADGSRYVDESGEAMMAINRSIGEVAEFVVKIANASAEQRSSIQQVSAAVTSMDSVTQQNGALVDQTSNSAVDLNSQAKTMMDRLSGFKLS